MFSILRVCRYVPRVACASVAAFLLGAPASARADDTYAAIAFSPKTGLCGHASSVDSQDKADAAALFNTKADDAKIVVRVKNGWCAMAVGAGKKYGVGTGADADTARKTAVAECKKLTTFVNAPRTSVPENPFDNLSYVVAVPSHVPPGRASAWEFNEAPTEPAGDTPAADAPAAADDQEKELARLINAHRAANDLPAVSVSKKLTKVAETHARDSAAHPGRYLHDWSESDKWTGGEFRKNYHIMWDKPKEIADYPGFGYENGAGGGDSITAADALKLWKGDGPHNDVILNKGIWKDKTWKAMGVGIYKGYAYLWFGEEADSD